MALNDIFTMIKADKYTQDGREELIKAQQAETEDKTYKPGDISERTGKQKQPDGSWKFPKGSSAAKHQKAMENAKKVGIVNKVPSGWKKAEGVMTTPNGYVAIQNGGSRFPKEGQKKFDLKFIKQEDFEKSAATKPTTESKPAEKSEGGLERRDYRTAMERNPRSGFDFKAAVSHSIPTNQTDYDELNGLAKFMKEEKATYQNALKSRAQALVDGHKSNGDWYPEKEQSIMKIAKAVGFDEELHKFIEEENRGYDLGYSEDEAPKIRELTGDCKIRIRK